MDLGAFDTSEALGTMEVRNPTTGEVLIAKDGEPVSITFIGQDHPKYLDISHKQQNRRIQRAVNVSQRAAVTSESVEADELELLAASVHSWHGIVLRGEELECNPMNARRLFADAGTRWLRKQSAAFQENRAEFLGNSSGT